MAANTGERTLIPAILPPGATFIKTIASAGFPAGARGNLVDVQGVMSSLIADLLIRMVAKNDIWPASVQRLPMLSASFPLLSHLRRRVLRLNAISSAYSTLWSSHYPESGDRDCWVIGPAYEHRGELDSGSPIWNESSPLRRASDRRAAQVELDAIVALGLGVSIGDLCALYRTQFPVLFGYDRREYLYDHNGRLVPNSVASVWRKKGDAITRDELTATNRAGYTYVYERPFVNLDREADMRQAYAHFERILQERL